MNAVLIAVLIMLVLSLLRVNVVVALLIGALTGGLIAGLSIEATLTAITEGLGNGATIALSYALLGGFAVAISRTGLPLWLVDKLIDSTKQSKSGSFASIKWFLLAAILLMSIASQNNQDPVFLFGMKSVMQIFHLCYQVWNDVLTYMIVLFFLSF